MSIRALFTIIVLLLPSAGLIACRTTSTAPPAVAAIQPVVSKPADPSTKPLTDDAVRLIAANCFNCHSPAGQGSSTIPTLANVSAGDLASRLKNFKTGNLTSTVMGRHAKAYSDAEIEAVAKYIAGRKN